MTDIPLDQHGEPAWPEPQRVGEPDPTTGADDRNLSPGSPATPKEELEAALHEEPLSIRDLAKAISPRVQTSPYVPDKTVYIMDDLGVGTPPEWDHMTQEERLLWSADNGHLLLVKNVGAAALGDER